MDGNSVDSETVRQADYEIKLRYAYFDPLESQPAVPADLGADGVNELHIVQFVTQPLSEFVPAVEAIGATVYQYLANYAYVVRAPASALGELRELSFVRSVAPYHPAYRLEESLLDELSQGVSSPEERLYSIMLLRRGPAGHEPVVERLAELGKEAYGMCPECIRLEAFLTLDELLEIVQMNEIAFIDLPGEIEFAVNNARQVCGANHIESLAGYRGTGFKPTARLRR
jgi:hypothetical protein